MFRQTLCLSLTAAMRVQTTRSQIDPKFCAKTDLNLLENYYLEDIYSTILSTGLMYFILI